MPAHPARPSRPVVQRYTAATIAELTGPGHLSENGNFFIPDSYGGELIYAISPPRNSQPHLKAITVGSQAYQGFVSSGKFLRDCLHTAEEVTAQSELSPGRVRSRVAGTGDAIGNSDADNILAATRHALDDAAAPGLGQAYAIVNTRWPGGASSPYHAAAVVATDGNDRITLEVFATSIDATKRNQNANYAMYTTGSGTGDKFHSHWQNRYFGPDSATVVIEPI